MSDAPERIWAATEPDDISAQIQGEVYAQQTPDGMVGQPVEYIRADLVPQWQSMDSAPKDGTEILGYVGAGYVGGFVMLKFEPTESRWEDWEDYGWEPTHWMLPPLPSD